MSSSAAFCDFLVASAALLPRGNSLHQSLVKTAIAELESLIESEAENAYPVERLLLHPMILAPALAVRLNRWSLRPRQLEGLEAKDHLLNRLALLAAQLNELRGGPFEIDTLSAAIAETLRDANLESVRSFIDGCWRAYSITHLDDYFSCYFPAIRAEGFGIPWRMARSEWHEADRTAEKDGHLNLLTRAQALADIDRRKGRDANGLEEVARRVFSQCEMELAECKERPYSEFVSGIRQIGPTYYCLRDVFYELHFLVEEESQKSEFEFLECFVDERHADIGQMVSMPDGGVILTDYEGLATESEKKFRRRMRFWFEARVQINKQLHDWLLKHHSSLPAGSKAQVIDDLSQQMAQGLSDAQRDVVRLKQETISRLTSGESNES